MTKTKIRLPNKILPISCADKEGWTEHWYEKRTYRTPGDVYCVVRLPVVNPPL